MLFGLRIECASLRRELHRDIAEGIIDPHIVSYKKLKSIFQEKHEKRMIAATETHVVKRFEYSFFIS